MKTIKQYLSVLLLTAVIFFCSVLTAQSQTMPRVLDTATISQQYEYLQGRTRIYNDFRAIREDMFQKIKENSKDSLRAALAGIAGLERSIVANEAEIDSLGNVLDGTREELDEAIRNRDNLSFLGIPMNKILYNLILWAVIAGLAFLLVLVFLMYSRSRIVSVQNQRDLDELKKEFEEYRDKARERYEKLTISHHNEIQRLKERKLR